MPNPFGVKANTKTIQSIVKSAKDHSEASTHSKESSYLESPLDKIIAGVDDQYASIVFLQGDEASEAFTILEEDGEDALLNYLTQWDYGEYHDISDSSQAGSDDTTFENGDYLVSYNRPLPYISLEKIISGEGVKDVTGAKVPVDALVVIPMGESATSIDADDAEDICSADWYDIDGVLVAPFNQAPTVLSDAEPADSIVDVLNTPINNIDVAKHRWSPEMGFYYE